MSAARKHASTTVRIGVAFLDADARHASQGSDDPDSRDEQSYLVVSEERERENSNNRSARCQGQRVCPGTTTRVTTDEPPA
jgi:hypothetical protein